MCSRPPTGNAHPIKYEPGLQLVRIYSQLKFARTTIGQHNWSPGMPRKDRPHTTDGRYLVAKGILKRCTNPAIDDSTRRRAVKKLMQARMSKDKPATLEAKIELGEAGPVWWDDDQPDYSGQHPSETPYAAWWDSLSDDQRQSGS